MKKKIILFLLICMLHVFSFAAYALNYMDAIKITLENDPNIKIQQNTAASYKGLLLVARSIFDPSLSATLSDQYQYTPLSPLKNSSLQISSSLGYSQKFRNGFTITPQITLNHSENYTGIPSTDIPNSLSSSITVSKSLLQGSSEYLVTSQEQIAGLNYSAANEAFKYQINTSIYNTLSTYWAALYYKLKIGILSDAESDSKKILQQTKISIMQDYQPSSDINQAEANLSDRTVSKMQAEQAYLDALQSLGISIGLPIEQTATIYVEEINFPQIYDFSNDFIQKKNSYFDFALKNRSDYQAYHMQTRAAKISVDVAKDLYNPNLTLNAALGYSGMNSKNNFYFFPSDTVGANGRLYLSLALPIVNNNAEGSYLNSKGIYEKYQHQQTLLKNTIQFNVNQSINDLHKISSQIKIANNSVNFYKISVENEKEKLRLGLSTLQNVITMQDKYVNSKLTYLGVIYNYFAALAKFQYYIQSFVTTQDGGININLNNVIEVPQV